MGRLAVGGSPRQAGLPAKPWPRLLPPEPPPAQAARPTFSAGAQRLNSAAQWGSTEAGAAMRCGRVPPSRDSTRYASRATTCAGARRARQERVCVGSSKCGQRYVWAVVCMGSPVGSGQRCVWAGRAWGGVGGLGKQGHLNGSEQGRLKA